MPAHLFLDVETYSSVDLGASGAYKYIASPDFEILIIGYAFDDGPVQTVDLAKGEALPEDLQEALTNPDVLKVAHNAVFERLSFRRIGIHIPIKQWYCTAVKSAYCGLPLSLDQVSKVLDIKDKKLASGKLLIKYFSCPCKPSKVNGFRARNYWHHAPDKWEMYKEYNRYDVLAEREIFHKLEKVIIPYFERELYVIDQHINDKGIMVDLELAKAAIKVNEEYADALTAEAKALTGLENPNSLAQAKKWIFEQTGKTVDSMAKGVIEDVKIEFQEYPKVMQYLDLRSRLSKTSIKKYYAMVNCAMADNRVRGTFQFYGANRTGRWAGRLLQLQNLSKNHIKELAQARELVRQGDWDTLEMLYGNTADILSQLVRTALIAPEGFLFSVADYSAIEARVISWFADEQWRLDVFHGDGKIYEATGSRMFNIPVSAITKGSDIRFKSKVAELSLGYGGSIGAFNRMGGSSMGLSNVEVINLVRKWRSSNPKIVAMWEELENAAIEAIRTHRTTQATSKNIIFQCDGETLTLRLPSGRCLFYRKPHLKIKKGKYEIYYEGVIQATKQWGEVDTYGGKLTENIVQATARDLLGYSMMQLAQEGYLPVCHIHDECLVEVPKDSAKEHYERMVKIMERIPAWAEGLPLRADGYLTPFYLKD